MLRKLCLVLVFTLSCSAQAGFKDWCAQFLGSQMTKVYTSPYEIEAHQVWNELTRFWSAELKSRRVWLPDSSLIFFNGEIDTPCGPANGDGPFYCSENKSVYVQREFIDGAERQFGVGGRVFLTYILAHEYGHHVLDTLGLPKMMESKFPSNTRTEEEQRLLEIKTEWTVDGLAGYFFAHLISSHWLSHFDAEKLLDAGDKVGDDTVAKLNNEIFFYHLSTHGRSSCRRKWLEIGLAAKSIDGINAFAEFDEILNNFELSQRWRVVGLFKCPPQSKELK